MSAMGELKTVDKLNHGYGTSGYVLQACPHFHKGSVPGTPANKKKTADKADKD